MPYFRSRVATALGCCAMAVTASAEMQTDSYSVDLPNASFSEFFTPGGPASAEISVPVAGLPKFDATLGTLTDVIVEFDWEFIFFVGIEAQGIFDDGLPHSAEGFADFFGIGVNFQRSDGGSGGSLYTQQGFGIGCFGEPFMGDGCFDGTGLEDSAFTNPTSLFGFTDVIGVGSLDIFSVDIIVDGTTFNLENVGGAFLDVTAEITAGSLTLSYVYDDGMTSPDMDADGVPDVSDICSTVPNADQLDADGDGYGNACDSDVNNDCVVNFQDLGLLRVGFFGSDPVLDFNGDGVANFVDLGLMRTAFFGAPGPSGTTSTCD